MRSIDDNHANRLHERLTNLINHARRCPGPCDQCRAFEYVQAVLEEQPASYYKERKTNA